MLPASELPLIGASGAVAGVIAAYLMLHPRVLVWVLAFRFIPLRISAAWVLGVWIATQVVMLVAQPADQVAWWAHIGGMVAGAVSDPVHAPAGVPLFDRRPHARSDQRCLTCFCGLWATWALPKGCPSAASSCPIDTQLSRPYAPFRTCEALPPAVINET